MTPGENGPVNTARRLLPLLLGTLVCAIGWAALVTSAIQLGRAAVVSGAVSTWLLTILACLGAVACGVLTILVGTRLVHDVRRVKDLPPKGGKRARR